MRWILIAVTMAALAGCNGGDGGTASSDIAANNRGVGLMGMYRYAEARDVFARLADKRPDWLDARVNLAIATLNRQIEGDEAEALKIVEAVLAEDPEHLAARYCAGIMKYRAGDPGALDDLRIVAEADPNDAYAVYCYAQALGQAGRADEALGLYGKCTELDPYLRSAYYAASRILIRQGKTDEGMEMLRVYEELEENPRARLFGWKYSEFGSKSMAIAIGEPPRVPALPPEGAVFAAPAPLVTGGQWQIADPSRAVSITASGTDLVYIPGVLAGPAPNAVIVGGTLKTDHALAAVPGVNAALWGDYDNDGLTDVYLCRRGGNALWRQDPAGTWTDVTGPTGTAGGERDTVDGAIFDADHDGDLDLFCVNADGPNELLNNNLDGTFRAIGETAGVSGSGAPSRQVVVTDLDGDRDADIIVINEQPPHEAWLNDRLWAYHAPAEPWQWMTLDIKAMVAADDNADGRVELMIRQAPGVTRRWHRTRDGKWQGGHMLAMDGTSAEVTGHQLAMADFNGDGDVELAASKGNWWKVLVPGTGAEGKPPAGVARDPGLAGWAPVLLEPGTGPAIVGMPFNGPPLVWRAGPGRQPFVALSFTGVEDPTQSMRSNASGIGVVGAVRTDVRWTAFSTYRHDSGPGQGLQPLAIGLGGHPHADFVIMDWPDGVLQSEVNGVEPADGAPPRDLAAGHVEVIREVQRQTSSCPVLFAWDGDGFAFVTDLLGVGGIGFLVAPGEYASPRPWENLLLPAGLLQPRDGRYVLKIGEPMQEACYLDLTRLVAWDLPPGWSVTIDERMSILGPEPTGEVRFYRDEVLPIRAVNDRGADVTTTILGADLLAAPTGPIDRRFIGRLATPHVLTLTFDGPLDVTMEGRLGEPMLVIDGWIEYPYAQTMFAAWQAGATYDAPTLEARAPDGQWHVVHEQFGYPAGMPRQMSVPLTGLPVGARELRLTTNQEVYWDRVSIAYAEPCPSARRHELAVTDARVLRSGFARRTTGPQRLPHYDYARRSPTWDTRHQAGFYTELGPARELVTDADAALAIFGPGEEVHVEFDASIDELPGGWTRRFVLETAGWCKDMDLYTRDGATVGPVPGQRDHDAEDLHRRLNTRYESGRR